MAHCRFAVLMITALESAAVLFGLCTELALERPEETCVIEHDLDGDVDINAVALLQTTIKHVDAGVRQVFPLSESRNGAMWIGSSRHKQKLDPDMGAGVHTVEANNEALFVVVGFVIASTLLGLLVPRLGQDRPQGWTIGMLLSSYMTLIPGLIAPLFAFKLTMGFNLGFIPFRKTLTYQNEPGDGGAVVETTVELVRMQLSRGAYVGAGLVVFYAMVVPALKLLLLGLGEYWRHSDKPQRVNTARTCIRAVKFISKWASPDMFAYILMFWLLRHMHHPPTIVVKAILDQGFLCFCVFCIFSTMSTLGIRDPIVPDPRSSENLAPRAHCDNPRIWMVIACHFTFVWLFIFGIHSTCMSMRLNERILLTSRGGPVPDDMLPLLQALQLGTLANADVSVLSALQGLRMWSADGELSLSVAYVMLAIFVVALPVLNMVLLLVVAIVSPAAGDGKDTATGDSPSASATFAMRVRPICAVLKHLEMLDVFLMGVVVVVIAAGNVYEEQGLTMSLQTGMLPLLTAEVVHYLTYYLVFGSPQPEAHDMT